MKPRRPALSERWLGTRQGDPFGRVRRAARAQRSSDETRFRDLLAASALAVFIVLALLWTAHGAFGASGPLSASHTNAGLACASCHAVGERGRACAGCHGEHRSTRVGHARLQASGELACARCHRAHGGAALAFASDGSTHFERVTGAPEAGVAAGQFRPQRPLTVPLVAARACTQCHVLRNARDPLWRCLPAVRRSPKLDGSLPTICFDEHRTSAEAGPNGTTARASRDAAVVAATELVHRFELRAAPPPRGWLALSFALALGSAVTLRTVLTRVRSRDARNTRTEPVSAVAAPARVRLPRVDSNTCLGCYACVDACPYDVLEVRRYVAVVVRPSACCGLTTCETACPNGSLVVREGPRRAEPRTTPELEVSGAPGVFLAGDVTGLSLVRNAIQQGERVVEVIARRLATARAGSRERELLDLVVVGAGPAGLAAGLAARAHGLSFRVLEQASVAESIRSFPRQKLVLDSGAVASTRLWLEECTKEELLGRWQRSVRRARLPVTEQARVSELRRVRAPGQPDFFLVTACVAPAGVTHTYRARYVLVATGRRGSPKKLAFELSGSVQDRVFYGLSDARSFAGRRVVIVGLGDVAMEAAAALAVQPGTKVVVLARGPDFSRGKARNIATVQRLVAEGRLTIAWQSELRAVTSRSLTVQNAAGAASLAYDALFVMIGTAPSWDLPAVLENLRAGGPVWP